MCTLKVGTKQRKKSELSQGSCIRHHSKGKEFTLSSRDNYVTTFWTEIILLEPARKRYCWHEFASPHFTNKYLLPSCNNLARNRSFFLKTLRLSHVSWLKIGIEKKEPAKTRKKSQDLPGVKT